LGLLVGLGLIDGELGGDRRLLERVRLRPRLLGRRVHGDHVLAALQQRFKDSLAECLLAVNHDTHRFLTPTEICVGPRLRGDDVPPHIAPTSCPRRRAPTQGCYSLSMFSLGNSCPPTALI